MDGNACYCNAQTFERVSDDIFMAAVTTMLIARNVPQNNTENYIHGNSQKAL
jgi:hypothetical protein